MGEPRLTHEKVATIVKFFACAAKSYDLWASFCVVSFNQ